MCLGVGPLCPAAPTTWPGQKLDNKLRLPFGLELVVQFEVCLGERCRVEARFAGTRLTLDQIEHPTNTTN
jgi:hypothetical protein